MAYFIDLKTVTDNRGSLTVIEDALPFEVKRIYYIYGADGSRRAAHRHIQTVQATICLHGSCEVYNNNGEKKENFVLDDPSKCLILEPRDWHVMHNFSNEAVLLVLASSKYDKADYIHEEYK
ncbi:MAG: FdtA/QdtA family cupin domain-containing protein [Ignavibacteriaceae bacterium]|nr:FdtA/QdtA family cupin domain-containing protein [Ignavibacteriaceae bacterium]NUM71310.1 FdtA/QdtA family cupin domain-containing protein [Ignavibacteriaceae bacterium]